MGLSICPDNFGSSHPEAAGLIANVLGDNVRVNMFRRKLIQPSSSGKFSLLKPLAKSSRA